MDNAQATLTEFGNSIGISPLQFDDNRSAILRIEGMGDLCIEKNEEGTAVITHMFNNFDYLDRGTILYALELCHYNNRIPFETTPTMLNERRIGFSIRFQPSDFTFQSLQRAIDVIDSLLQKLHHYA